MTVDPINAIRTNDLDICYERSRDNLTIKKAAGRPKDLIELEILAALKEERER